MNNIAARTYPPSQPRDTLTPSLMHGFPAKQEDQVVLENWMHPPYNRWSFRNTSRLLPSIDVEKGSGPESPLREIGVALGDLHFDSVDGTSVSVSEHLAASYTDAFLVLRNDEVLFEGYYNGQRPQDRHMMFSVTKSLTGAMAEQLIHESKLNPQTQARHYVPELAGSAFGDATVRQLLDMAVGIDYTEVYDDPSSGSSQYCYASGLLPAPAGCKKYESLYQYLPTLQKRGEHGNLFHYVTATTEALGWVLERVTGQSCAVMLQSIWQRLGCQRDGFFLVDPWGRGLAGGGFNATLRDMGRFGRLIANRGLYGGEQLFAPQVIERIAQGANPLVYGADPEFAKWTPGASYRSQWYVFNDHSQALMAGGVHGQYLFIDLPSQVVIVKQSSLPQAITDFDPDSVRMMRTIVSELSR